MHHENVDGSGYPDGLAGGHTPPEARIVQVADDFDAMTNRRPYAEARSLEAALEELDRCKAAMFDPDLVELFIGLLRDPTLVARLTALQARPFPGDRSTAA